MVDSLCHFLPYDSNTFDIVMSDHVIGYDYEKTYCTGRVTKPGDWILDCPGEDDQRKAADQEMLSRGFEPLYCKSKNGGNVYRYRKQVQKQGKHPTRNNYRLGCFPLLIFAYDAEPLYLYYFYLNNIFLHFCCLCLFLRLNISSGSQRKLGQCWAY